MSPTKIRSVAIIGGGPAGASLAAYLAKAGIATVFFTRGKRPPIIVGESLVPAVIPFLQRLGIEDEVREYAYFKEGATFVFNGETEMSFRFDSIPNATTKYSYNVPRDRFDATIVEVAKRSGAIEIPRSVRVVQDPENGRIRLDDESREVAREALGGDPDFIVDAGGRNRQLARLMKIQTIEGPRKDTALHAHYVGVPTLVDGNVHTDRLENGWSWRIPLPDRVSVGIVIDRETIKKYGDSNEEQLDNYLAYDEVTRGWAEKGERITPVIQYTNYQLRATHGIGDGWALLGDAYGFIDPVFSSGMLIAMQSADVLADALIDGSQKSLQRYDAYVQRNLRAWQQIADHYYSGRLLTMFRVGEYVRQTLLGKTMDWHFRRHMPRIFTGEGTTNRYNLGLVNFLCQYGLAGNDPENFAIR